MLFNKPLLAIDIGSFSIKIIESNRAQKITKINLSQLPKQIIQNGIIQDPVALEDFLRNFFKKIQMNSFKRRIILSLGGSTTIIKKLRFNRSHDKDSLIESINLEAEQAFQHDINDLYYDFHILEQSQEILETEVVLVGAKRDIIEQYLNVLNAIGLKVGIIDCDVFALTNIVENSYGIIDGISAIINVGFSSTQVIFINGKNYLFTRDIAIGGNTYTQNIAASKGIPLEDAERYKTTASQEESVESQLLNIIQETNNQLVSEIQMTIDFFFQSGEAPTQFDSIANIILSGGGAYTLGLDATIASQLQAPITFLDPFRSLKLKNSVNVNSKQGPLFSVASGLSIRANENYVAKF